MPTIKQKIESMFDEEFRQPFKTETGSYDDKWLNCSVPEIKSFITSTIIPIVLDELKVAYKNKRITENCFEDQSVADRVYDEQLKNISFNHALDTAVDIINTIEKELTN